MSFYIFHEVMNVFLLYLFIVFLFYFYPHIFDWNAIIFIMRKRQCNAIQYYNTVS